jgi:hypothetical protein
MWRPKSYQDVERAVGELSEAADLDFKRDVGASVKDLAKDAAAMSIEGGVIVIGMDERGGQATALTPVPLEGTPERIQQVVDSRVRPPVAVEIESIRESPDHQDGFVVVTVPASSLAPHMIDNKFPARSGTTTRWMDEAEVERLYQRRGAMLAQTADTTPLSGFTWPPGSSTGGRKGIGRMRLHVRPVALFQHPSSPWLRGPLREAVDRAQLSVVPDLIDVEREPSTFEELRPWKPRGSTGCVAGNAHEDFAVLKQQKLVAAIALHSGDLSYLTTMAVLSQDESFFCAYEQLWAAELIGQLSISGYYFEPIPSASLVRCDLELEGLEGCVSWRVSGGRSATEQMSKVTDTVYVTRGLFAARELAADPRDAARELLGPLLASFIDEGYDVIECLRR